MYPLTSPKCCSDISRPRSYFPIQSKVTWPFSESSFSPTSCFKAAKYEDDGDDEEAFIDDEDVEAFSDFLFCSRNHRPGSPTSTLLIVFFSALPKYLNINANLDSSFPSFWSKNMSPIRRTSKTSDSSWALLQKNVVAQTKMVVDYLFDTYYILHLRKIAPTKVHTISVLWR